MAKVELTIAAAFEATDAVSGFDDIATAADDMAGSVSDSADSVSEAADEMGSISDTAKDVSSNSRLATGSLNAMAGGLDLVGASGAADALRQVSTVTSTLGGVGKAAVLVLKSQAVQTQAVRVAQIAQAATTRAISAATKAYSVVQWALNAALSANPIGLIIVLIAGLVAGIVLAYKKSDTFRAIVDKAFSVAKTVVQNLVDVVKGVPGFIQDVVDKAGFMAPAFKLAKDLIVGYFDAMTLPIRTVISLVETVIDKISHIHLPDIPGFGRVGAGGSSSSRAAAVGLAAGDVIVPVRVEGGFVGNEVALARVIRSAVAAELRRRGVRP
jgi:F0F1-type ATP synthase assembly protein I